jgi:hypothetical protein
METPKPDKERSANAGGGSPSANPESLTPEGQPPHAEQPIQWAVGRLGVSGPIQDRDSG